jgi:hypothetical protein
VRGATRLQGNEAAEDELADTLAPVLVELWASLASILKSYTALHGINRGLTAEVDWDAGHISVRNQKKWLDMRREGAAVNWVRENGESGVLELTESGRLRSAQGEQEMDLAAEAWARELMA